MARKTFISYKYSEAKELRDIIIENLGDDATYYKGEEGTSPDRTGQKADTIKKYLKDMIHDTSVLIVIISPNMIESNWIDWEISYALKEITRSDKTSRINGVLGVVQKVNDSYDWFITTGQKYDGCSYIDFDTSKLYPIISDNRYNSNPSIYHCEDCKLWCSDKGSYISLVKEEIFLGNPQKYIEKAYDKIDEKDKYEIVKEL